MRKLRPGLCVSLMIAVMPSAMAANGPALKMLVDDGEVYVLLSNHGDKALKVRTDFLLDSLVGSLSFKVRKGTTELPLSAHINPNLPTEATYIRLPTGFVHGQVFGKWFIAHMYGMGVGCYDISVIYRDKMASNFAAFGDEIKSNPVRLCIDAENSGVPLSIEEAKTVAEKSIPKRSEAAGGASVTALGEIDDFFRFAVRSQNRTSMEIFVDRRTAETWILNGKQCVRVEREGLASVYSPPRVATFCLSSRGWQVATTVRS
ncbi:hypothetical protein J2T07_001871 [Luteibacter jiangsuensis]|uniref:Uncharacterized protein n=1 Tax=Luteibacter jiangsuensis TaxID=637577 RepID=A0ABT9SXG5_9GAMM|nr:hypothetical protein [Luteibacter jiangsuensis]MDQ0009694.1 hypothetical protein [Luteibacter jiangsuensis]